MSSYQQFFKKKSIKNNERIQKTIAQLPKKLPRKKKQPLSYYQKIQANSQNNHFKRQTKATYKEFFIKTTNAKAKQQQISSSQQSERSTAQMQQEKNNLMISQQNFYTATFKKSKQTPNIIRKSASKTNYQQFLQKNFQQKQKLLEKTQAFNSVKETDSFEKIIQEEKEDYKFHDQLKQHQTKFQQLMNQAKNNLIIASPQSNFLILESYKCLSKSQRQKIDKEWIDKLENDMYHYEGEKKLTFEDLNFNEERTSPIMFTRGCITQKQQAFRNAMHIVSCSKSCKFLKIYLQRDSNDF